MIVTLVAGEFTCGFGFGYNADKVVLLGITKQVLEVTGQPIFHSSFDLPGV